MAARMSPGFAYLRRLWEAPQVRFLMVGAFTFVLPLGVAAILREGLGLMDQLVFFLASVLAVEVNFLLSYFFTWRVKMSGAAFLRAFLRFHFAKIVTVALAQLIFAILDAISSFYPAYVGAVALMTAVNYLSHRLWIFRQASTPKKF